MPESRPPTTEEVHAAHLLATRLGNAQVRARQRTTRYSQKPAGRINHRRAMRYEAQEAAGSTPTAQPYAHNVYRPEIDPPLRVGFVFDVSQSMNHLAGVGSSLAWVLRSACRKVDAEIAGTWFGHAEYGPLIKSNKVLAQVPEVDCYGNTSHAADALDLLDAALNLSGDGSGARVVVVLSDGDLNVDNEERLYAFGEHLDALAEDGVVVIWMQDARDNEPKYMGRHRKVVTILPDYAQSFAQRLDALTEVLVRELQNA